MTKPANVAVVRQFMCATTFPIDIDHADLSAENIESTWVEVNRLNCKKLFVGCVYNSPKACSDTFIDLLNDSLSKLPTGSQIILFGDSCCLTF